MGQATAQMNVSDLRKVLGLPTSDLSPDSMELVSPGLQRYGVRRQSMEQLDLFEVWYATSAALEGRKFHAVLLVTEKSLKNH
jgi:hypothetical protein